MKSFSFLKGLSSLELKQLENQSKYIEIKKDTILFYQDDICKDVLFLKQGEIRLYLSSSLNEEIPLYKLKKDQQCIINTSSVLSNTKAIASAVTLCDIKGFLVPKKNIQELIQNNIEYQKFIFSLFALKFSSLSTLVEDIKFKRLDSRVLEYLNKTNKNIISITHESLAEELGTSRVVISRVLKDLENKNMIKLYRGEIELLSNVT